MDSAISIKGLGHTYRAGTPMAVPAIYDIDLEISRGKITAVIGHTGSGKSTLIQHLNGLLRPTVGRIQVDDYVLTADKKSRSLRDLRHKVGIVFQFPESQLFGETVLEDVMFGPLNFKKTPEEAEKVAREKLALVHIGEELFKRSPFELSGGQMRRTAIAGIMALEPEVLVLDEPTAGLDPKHHSLMMEMFQKIQREEDLTIVLVTHQMQDVIKYADEAVILEEGTVIRQGTTEEIFRDSDWLSSKQLDVPESVKWLNDLDLAPDGGLPKDASGVVERILRESHV